MDNKIKQREENKKYEIKQREENDENDEQERISSYQKILRNSHLCESSNYGYDEQSLVEKFTPLLVFHQKEKYMPCSFEWFISHSQLYQSNDARDLSHPDHAAALFKHKIGCCNTENMLIADYGLIKMSDLTENRGSELRMHPDCLTGQHDYFVGPIKYIIKNDIPIYVSIKYPIINGQEYVDITYSWIHAYNGPYSFLGIKFGDHLADLEHVTIRIIDNQLHAVYFSYHAEGMWLSGSEIEYAKIGELNHPIIYVALNSHECYPTAGRKWRMFGIANDHCSSYDEGIKWLPNNLIHITPTFPEWMAYQGHLGMNGIDTFSKKSWFLYGEENYSSTLLRNVFVPWNYNKNNKWLWKPFTDTITSV